VKVEIIMEIQYTKKNNKNAVYENSNAQSLEDAEVYILYNKTKG
jgi:hypothetical protein